MTMAAQIREDARAQARKRLREAVLDAAYAGTIADGWSSVRIGAIAAQVGVSRQTLHNEFGTKDALGQALVLREAEAFLQGVAEALLHAGDPADAVAEATVEALTRLAENPLLQSILATPADDALLPLLTSRSGPLLDRAGEVLLSWARSALPDVAQERLREMADVVVRLVISHAVMPGAAPEAVGRLIARLFAAGLR